MLEPLTNREMDVLELLAQRLSTKEIAEVLVVAPSTVQTHLSNLFQKLEAENRRDAVLKARAVGILA
jgi:ATP/maltotriose-dependent transcriptional regulator MalT